MIEFEPKILAGRCRNGAERDSGKLWHAVPKGEVYGVALCGAKPGRTSVGWSSWCPDDVQITCNKCLRKIKKNEG